MGLFNRPYWRDSGGAQGGQGWGDAGLRLALPKPGRVVIALIAACVVMFIVQAAFPNGAVNVVLALYGAKWYQAWRLVTFQFLHEGPSHLIFNLMGLYFFGPPLESQWGGRRFLGFYLACGCLAGATFVVLGLMGPAGGVALVGTSGGVLACVAACAILMPHMNILLIPIRVATLILLALYGLNVAGEMRKNGFAAIGDAAHLGGMIAGGLWATVWRTQGPGIERPSMAAGLRIKLQRGAWKRKQEAEARRRSEVDRILEKVHQKGIASLSGREKRTLQEETERQREGRGRL